MELRVLRYFLAVAKEGSFTKAANFLNITQPTLSRQIMDLEEELGHKLFIRSSHGFSLTTKGMMLRKRAEEIVDMAERTKAEIISPAENIGGDIYIGCGETQAMRLIAKIIRDLRKDYPDIRYHLQSGNAEDVTDRLDKGLLDFGILIQPINLTQYDSITLPIKDVWGVLMPQDCKLIEKESIRKEDLLNLPLICSRQAIAKTSSRNEFLEWFGEDFAKMNIIATYNLVFNAALLAEQNNGYVITLDKLANTMESNVCFRPLYPKLESELNIVWKKYRTFSPAAKIFLEVLRKKFIE